jgi:RHS repeat-associated protein
MESPQTPHQVFDVNNIMIKRSDYVGSLFLENDTLKFINHAEGRIIPAKVKTETNEYQYNLKDHLGNVRLTFTTKDETETVLATLEPNHADDDRANFLYYHEAILVTSNLFDHTNNTPTPTMDDSDDTNDTGWGAATGTSTRLTGTDYNNDGVKDDQYGLARSISVMPGDVVNMEVWAKYFDALATPQGSPLSNFIAYLGSIGAATTGTIIDGGAVGSLGAFGFPLPPIDHNAERSGDTAPKAYLNYIFMDREMNESSRQAAAWQITTQGAEHGQDRRHDFLSLTFKAKEAGFLYIYVSNDNPQPVEVYFDDFKVEHIKSPVVQQDDYYPFGLTFNSYSRENSVKQNFTYNGKEKQDELDLGWLDYGARMYMSDIGKWIAFDPHSENYFNFSPYHYALDNPNNVIDPNGRDVEFAIKRDENGQITDVTVKAKIYITGDGASDKRADELTCAAESVYKSSTTNGVNISFDVKYEYSKDIKAEDLKGNENMLTFHKEEGRSHVQGREVLEENEKGLLKSKTVFSGNTGDIYGKDRYDDHATLHESLHFMGISDRYYESGGYMDHFKHDIMGSNENNVGDTHYEAFRQGASFFPAYPFDKSREMLFINRIHVDMDSRGNLLPPTRKQIEDDKKRK